MTVEEREGAPAEALLEDLRRVEVQAIGAAISRRDWHEVERSYELLRDELDRALIRFRRNG